MSRKLIASLACATLLGAGTAYAGAPAAAKPGEWTRETRQVGNKVTIDVYQRTPYALTGDLPAVAPAASGKLTRETRQLGNKVTIEVYRR